MSLQDKRACLWHAFCTLDEQRTGAVLKSKLKVLTHNIANCLGVQKVEDRLAEFTELATINFADYYKFFHNEIVTQFTNQDEINANVDMDKIDEVCWFVTHAKTFMHRQMAVLEDSDLYRLWRLFNFLAERNEDGVEIPVVMDTEEVELLLHKFHSASGTKFNSTEFHVMGKEIAQFNVAQLVNLIEEHHCKGVDAETISNAVQEIYDEHLAEVIKKGYLNKKGTSKMTTWKERWFVLSPRFLSYYTSRDETDRKGQICVCDMNRVESLSEKTSTKLCRFQIVCDGRTYEINSNDHRTRVEWMTAIRSVLTDCKNVKTSAKELRDERREMRNEKRRKEREEEERKKSDQMSYEKTRLELEVEREARSAAEAKAKLEEEMRHEEAKKSLEMFEAEKKSRQEWESQMQDEASQLKAAIAERECLQSQQQLRAFQMLESEKQVREELEVKLREQALLREEEHQRLCELEELQTKLQALLEEERQAKRDEEIVRAAQARVLNEELEKREELERMRDELEGFLKEEQERREQLELIGREQEELLREGQQRMEQLTESEQQREKQLEIERSRLEDLIQSKEQQEKMLKAEQQKLELLECEKADVDGQYEEALRKLQEAEKAREEMKSQMKQKEYEVHIVPPINRLIAVEAKPLVSHRGQGAFVDADFSKQTSINESENEP